MEVHHHSNTVKKKWTHYLWEFLMLFLAVFCGFLAENFREHLIEQNKEKDFVKSLLEDLKIDTTRLNYSISRLKGNISYTDSLVIFYVKENKEKEDEKRMTSFGLNAGHSVDIVFTDRTSSQLKGTGSMRLIRNKTVADSILQYWSNQIWIAQIHDRFETYRLEQRKIGWKTFNWYPLNLLDTGPSVLDYRTIRKMDSLSDLNLGYLIGINNKQTLNEFINVSVALYNTAASQYLPKLETESALAYHLILLIQKEYNLH